MIEHIRLECLKVAAQSDPPNALETAKRMADWIISDWPEFDSLSRARREAATKEQAEWLKTQGRQRIA